MIFMLGVSVVFLNALCISRVIRPSFFLLKRRFEGNSSEPVFRLPCVSKSSILFFISSFVFLILYLMYVNNIASIIVCVMCDISLSCILILRKPSQFEANQLLRNNNLNVGYGCAQWYYYNYLKMIRNSFLERVERFVTEQEVILMPKLFILFPLSGMNKDYIDDTKNIQRCRELLTFYHDYAGTDQRVYNLTVYKIIEPFSQNSVRCIIEYAQPLKTLRCLQKHFTESDMKIERDIYYNSLNHLIKNDAYSKQFELVRFDDFSSELHEIMYEVVRKHVKQM